MGFLLRLEKAHITVQVFWVFFSYMTELVYFLIKMNILANARQSRNTVEMVLLVFVDLSFFFFPLG